MSLQWAYRRGALDLATPRIMGIVNVTPDSFSDGGKLDNAEHAVQYGLQLASEGADVIDVGGESTRPGAPPVDLEEELERVIPVIRGLRKRSDVVISIDTTKVQVARAAIEAGADIINDISAFTFEPNMASLAATSSAGVCLMHTPGRPEQMQKLTAYGDVVLDVREFLRDRIETARAAGISAASIVVDPGFGFGKTKTQNYSLLRRTSELVELGFPVLIGLSRKRMIRDVVGAQLDRVEHGTTAANIAALLQGASVLRVHNVVAADAARRICAAIEVKQHETH